MPAFAGLPERVLDELARSAREEAHPPGSIIVAEGQIGESFYLIVAGRTEVATGLLEPRTTLATLGAGETFGEIALLSPSARRSATVSAVTPVVLLAIPATVFRHIVSTFRETRDAFARIAEILTITTFLKQSSPFTTMSPPSVRQLAAQLEHITVPAGCMIVQQGTPGDRCYLLRRGSVEVLQAGDDADDRRIATLRSGAMFGELALLTSAPRNASVRALEECELLGLRRADLLDAMHHDRGVEAHVTDLGRARDRPRRVGGTIAQHCTTADGDTITILTDPRRGAYYRLSPYGWFVWQRLDGQHTLRDLTVDYFTSFKTLAPEQILEIIAGLAAAGFVESRIFKHALDGGDGDSRMGHWLRGARRALEWRWALPTVDPLVSRIFRAGGFLVYTRSGLLLLALLSVTGLVAFVSSSYRMSSDLRAAGAGGALLLLLLPARLGSVVLHELGHALTMKAFGRRVGPAGIGWYWFQPIAFVDTSDMWLAPRRARIAVSLAGPAADLIVAGIASIAASFARPPVLTALLWGFALLSYVAVVLNLNPLLEYDGYYVLADLLDRPNLRQDALTWIGAGLVASIRRAGLRGLHDHWLEAAYGGASLLYVLSAAMVIVVFYRVMLQDWLATITPVSIAAGLGWSLAVAVLLTAAIGILADLRAGSLQPRALPPARH